MQIENGTGVVVETAHLASEFLERTVQIDLYFPANSFAPDELSLLLINDGQDLAAMGFDKIIGYMLHEATLRPVLCVGIHAGEDRKSEYGMAASPDHKGRGARAGLYQRFVIEELLPYLYGHYRVNSFAERAFAGFSIGALSAFDLVWNNPDVFTKVGVFSGSLWWRKKDKSEKDYSDATDRLVHRQVRQGNYRAGMKFFFECGERDETEDRNKNGVIDSIDDTIDLMRELMAKGYLEGKDMAYLQLKDGRHDVPTWAKALPVFLKWGWRNKK